MMIINQQIRAVSDRRKDQLPDPARSSSFADDRDPMADTADFPVPDALYDIMKVVACTVLGG
jgi:hypothetical protein